MNFKIKNIKYIYKIMNDKIKNYKKSKLKNLQCYNIIIL